MSEHTKEPWSVTNNSWEISTIYDAESNIVCEVDIDSEATEETQSKFEAIKEANARRIVACVNACAGIPTELIEQGGFAAVPVATHREVKQQRDDLLAALKAARLSLQLANDSPDEIITDTIWHTNYETLFDFMDAAISKAEGQS